MRTLLKQSCAAAAIALSACAAGADSIDPAVNEMALFGVNRDTGQLMRYDFPTGQTKSIGSLRINNGSPLTGVDASAYIAGHQCAVVFWDDPADGKAKMVYVDTETGDSAIVGSDLGIGHVHGAVAALTTGHVQVAGQMGINPNNSPDNEFHLTKPDGQVITRDDLHQDTNTDGDGVFYQGPASYVRVKPKGSGTQNELLINGNAVALQNNEAYAMVGELAVKVYNDHIHNGKAMGKWWIEFSPSMAHVHGIDGVAQWQQWAVYAVQKVEDAEDEAVDFAVVNDSVVPSEAFAAKVTVLGAAITYGGEYAVPVTLRAKAGLLSTVEPFGDFTKPVNATVNDANNPRHYVFPDLMPAGTALNVIARSWVKKNNSYSGANNSHWETYMTVDGSTVPSQQVIVLRNGSSVPMVPGFMDQDSVVDFVRDFVDPQTNEIVLDENQAIFLFELGTTDMSSSAADFQDLVVLVTLGKSVADLADNDDDDSNNNDASRLLKINHKSGGYAQVMTLDRTYDSIATIDGFTFYGTIGSDLYRIDLVSQTETLVGAMPDDNMTAMEFAGSSLFGFETDGDKVRAVSSASGAGIGTPESMGMSNLGTMFFLPLDQDPAAKSKSYD